MPIPSAIVRNSSPFPGVSISPPRPTVCATIAATTALPRVALRCDGHRWRYACTAFAATRSANKAEVSTTRFTSITCLAAS